MFPERRMSALEQDSGRTDIRSERSQGWRSERSGGNMPSLLLGGNCFDERLLKGAIFGVLRY